MVPCEKNNIPASLSASGDLYTHECAIKEAPRLKSYHTKSERKLQR